MDGEYNTQNTIINSLVINNIDQNAQQKEMIYILYGYNAIKSTYPTVYIMGIYNNINDTLERINMLCKNDPYNMSHNIFTTQLGWVYYTKQYPLGDQYIEK